jgi:hypothetical protein
MEMRTTATISGSWLQVQLWNYGKYARVVTNVEMRTTISASLAAAGAAPEDNYGDRAFADGQWKCVRPAQLPGSCCMRQSWYYASGRAGFCNGEWRM